MATFAEADCNPTVAVSSSVYVPAGKSYMSVCLISKFPVNGSNRP